MKIFLGLILAAALATTAALIAIAPNETGTLQCAGDELTFERQSITSALYACIVYTPTPAPTATNTPVAATAIPFPTATPSVDTAKLAWHAPGAHSGLNVHEHGDSPQDFFQAWSIATFGHSIVYGGDEASSPMENGMKHQAFKGIRAVTVAGGQVYLRYHAASNAMDRAAQYHSYEVYYRDTAGNISFWQGLYDSGDPNTDARCPRRNPAIACENQRPIILVVDATSLQQGIASEQWYLAGSPQSGVSWDMGVTIIGSTTIYQVGENATAHDYNSWVLTGNLGLTRRSDGFWYRGRGGGGTSVIGWFCAEPLGRIVSAGSQTCPAGSLPQYIAPTLARDARSDGFGNNRIEWLIQKQFPGAGAGVTTPN